MSDADEVNLYRVTPRQARELIMDCLYAGLVPMTTASPGTGKSQIHYQISEFLGLKMIDHRASTSDPSDFTGLPNFVDGRAEHVPFKEIFPLECDPLPEGKQGWMLFLDEINSARRATQAAMYKTLLDRMTGQKKLHPNVLIACAGNLMSDRAITEAFGTAMQSRLIHIEMIVSFQEWLEDVALAQKYDGRIVAYLSQYESKLMDFRPDHTDRTFCCPRTWEFMNRLTQGVLEIPSSKTALYAGTITSGVAVDFVEFCKVYKTLLTIKAILADPEGCEVPRDANSRWALITHLMEKIDEKNYGDLATFADRFPTDMRILFHRATQVQHPELREHPAFRKSMLQLNRYLN